MISDTLFHAVAEIERYEREMPDIYGQWRYRWRLAITRAVMNWMRCQPGMDSLPRRGWRRFVPRLPRNHFRRITDGRAEAPEPIEPYVCSPELGARLREMGWLD